jgi:hypothetical protein
LGETLRVALPSWYKPYSPSGMLVAHLPDAELKLSVIA